MRDPRLIEFAKHMRREMTEPEKRLWYQLRAKRFEGTKFRKQKIVGSYIIDFSSNEPKLAIEIDGNTHADRQEYDAIRTEYLEQQGYKVIRFSNRDVMENLEEILETLAAVIAEMRPPLPTLSPEGERTL
jgi:very-short-patch-repair endonuclease